MINLYPKNQGAATLLITFVLLTAAVLTIIFATNNSRLQQKSSTNQYNYNQAFEAAEGGLEFGIQYLTQNSSVILANPVGGFIPNYSDSSTTDVILTNNSKYSITYSNPIANNYKLILVRSTGTNADSTSTRLLQQIVQKRSFISKTITNPATILGDVSLQGNSSVAHDTGATTITAGGTVSIQGAASTDSKSSGSNMIFRGSDIQQNVSSLKSMTSDQFFMSYFNTGTSTIKSQVSQFFPAGSSPNLEGMVGTSIWIDQSYSVSGNITIGSPSQPVILIVNGNFSISGNIAIYGFIYVNGNIDSSAGNTLVDGAIAATGDMTYKGTADLNFNPTVINNLINTTPSYFAKVPGTWKDF